MKTTKRRGAVVTRTVKAIKLADHLPTLREVSDQENATNQAERDRLVTLGYGFAVSSLSYEVQHIGETIAILQLEQPREKLPVKQRNHLFRNHTAMAVAAAQAHEKKNKIGQASLFETAPLAQLSRE